MELLVGVSESGGGACGDVKEAMKLANTLVIQFHDDVLFGV
jgi:hypothetical protein